MMGRRSRGAELGRCGYQSNCDVGKLFLEARDSRSETSERRGVGVGSGVRCWDGKGVRRLYCITENRRTRFSPTDPSYRRVADQECRSLGYGRGR